MCAGTRPWMDLRAVVPPSLVNQRGARMAVPVEIRHQEYSGSRDNPSADRACQLGAWVFKLLACHSENPMRLASASWDVFSWCGAPFRCCRRVVSIARICSRIMRSRVVRRCSRDTGLLVGIVPGNVEKEGAALLALSQ
jgi:hypothetical protein